MFVSNCCVAPNYKLDMQFNVNKEVHCSRIFYWGNWLSKESLNGKKF